MNVDVLAPQAMVRANATDEYGCFRTILSLDQPVDAVELSAVIDQAAVVHHILVFRDRGKNHPEQRTGLLCAADMISQNDWELLRVWAAGGGPSVMPPDAGVRLQNGDYIVVQVHDNNPTATAVRDASGVRFKTTAQLRPNEASSVGVGLQNFSLPAGQAEISRTGECTLTTPVTIFAQSPHMPVTRSLAPLASRPTTGPRKPGTRGRGTREFIRSLPPQLRVSLADNVALRLYPPQPRSSGAGAHTRAIRRENMVQPPKNPAYLTHGPAAATSRSAAESQRAPNAPESSRPTAGATLNASDRVAARPPSEFAAFAEKFERNASEPARNMHAGLLPAGAKLLPGSGFGARETALPSVPPPPAPEVKAPAHVLVESELAQLQQALHEIQDESMVRKDPQLNNAMTLGAKSLLRKAKNQPWRSPAERRLLTGVGITVKGLAWGSKAVGLPHLVACGMRAAQEKRGGSEGDTTRRSVEMKRKRLYEVQKKSVSAMEKLLFTQVFDQKAGRFVDTLHEDFRHNDQAIQDVSRMLNGMHRTVMATASAWGLETAWTPTERELLPALIDKLGATAIDDQRTFPSPDEVRNAVLDAVEKDDPKILFACLKIVNGQILRSLQLEGRPLLEAVSLKAASSKKVPTRLLKALFDAGVRADRGAIDAAVDSGIHSLFDALIAHKSTSNQPAASVGPLARTLERGDLALAKKVAPHIQPASDAERESLLRAALRAPRAEVFAFAGKWSTPNAIAPVALEAVRTRSPERVATLASKLGYSGDASRYQQLLPATEAAFEMQRFDLLLPLLRARAPRPKPGLEIIRAARQAGAPRKTVDALLGFDLDASAKNALFDEALAAPNTELLLQLVRTGKLPEQLSGTQVRALLDRGRWDLVKAVPSARFKDIEVTALADLLEMASREKALKDATPILVAVDPSAVVRTQLFERALKADLDDVLDVLVDPKTHPNKTPHLEPRLLAPLENDLPRYQKVANCIETTPDLLADVVERKQFDSASALLATRYQVMPEPLVRRVLDLGRPQLAARMVAFNSVSAGLKRKVIEEGHLEHFAAHARDRMSAFVCSAYSDDAGLRRIQQIVSEEPFDVLKRIVRAVSAAGGEGLVEQLVNLRGVREAAQSRQLTDQKDVVVYLRQRGQRGALPEDKKKKG